VSDCDDTEEFVGDCLQLPVRRATVAHVGKGAAVGGRAGPPRSVQCPGATVGKVRVTPTCHRGSISQRRSKSLRSSLIGETTSTASWGTRQREWPCRRAAL